MPFEGARVQSGRESTRTDIEGLRNHRRMPGLHCDLDLGSEHKLTLTFAEPGLRNVSKQLLKVQSV